MACNCNSFRRMIERNFAKAEEEKKRKEGKVDPEKEYEKKLLAKENENK